MKKIKYYLLVSTFTCVKFYGQINNPVSDISPKSPTSAALIKYVDFGMNSNKGTPDISIPIYEIKTKELQLPISISYNAGGIKVNEQAGNVGLGWNLNAGGLITRTIRGQEDNSTFYTQAYNEIQNGFNPQGNINDYNLANSISNGSVDGVPDLYSYAFDGKYGKFIDVIGKGISLMPQVPIKIEKYGTTAYVGISNYKITSENGTKYYFEAIEESRIRTSYSINKSGYNWKLTKIESANNTDQIIFNYEDEYHEDLPAVAESYSFLFSSSCIMPSGGQIGYTPSSYHTSSSRISGKQLKSIEFNEGKIEFELSYARQDAYGDPDYVVKPEIDHIYIKDKNGNIIKTVFFNYSYYNATSVLPYSKRLKLDAVSFYPKPSDFGNPDLTNTYSFEYNSTPLPQLTSKAQDHWGYYNGFPNNTLIPSFPSDEAPTSPLYSSSPFCVSSYSQQQPYKFQGANKKTDTTFVKAGVLTKVIFPTGGYTKFDYASNEVAPYTYSGVISGGCTAGIVNNTQQNGTLVHNTSNTSPLGACPGGSCAKLNIYYGYPNVANYILVHWKPYVEVYASDPVNGTNTLIKTVYLNGLQTSDFSTFTIAQNKSYFIKVYTKLNGSTINAQLSFDAPTGQLTKPHYIGGLRLRRKDDFDGINSYIVTKYQYSNCSARGADYVSYHNEYAGPNHSTCSEQCYGASDPEGGAGTGYTNNKYLTLTAYHGGADPDVNYGVITTIYGANGENGKTVKVFETANSDNFWRMGNLLSQSDYDASGTLLKKVVNQYVSDNTTAENIMGVEITSLSHHPCLLNITQGAFNSYSKNVGQKDISNVSEWYTLRNNTVTRYNKLNGDAIVEKTSYFYYNSQHKQVNIIKTISSKGDSLTTMIRYPQDYNLTGTLSGFADVLNKMIVNKNMLAFPIEKNQIIRKNGTNQPLISSGEIDLFKLNGSLIVPDKKLGLKINSTPTSLNESIINNFYISRTYLGAFSNDNRYEEIVKYNYSNTNDILDVNYKGTTNGFIMNPITGKLWANVQNAVFNDIAYTGFEHDNIATNFTNWNYSNSGLVSSAGVSGDKVYNLSSSNITNLQTLDNAKTYKISFWSDGSNVSVSANGNNINLVQGPTRMNYTYYEALITNASNIVISGSAKIDELRLCPDAARMKSYTYKDLVGLINECNENNQINYYEYDALNRLKIIKDQDGNILKKTDYKYLQTAN